MDFDDQMRRYFGTDQLGTITPAALEAGVERMSVDLGLEQDRSRRFALWALMHALGVAPDVDTVFERPDDRDAARAFMDLSDQADGR